MPAASKIKGVSKEELEEATKWVGGLDRINRACGILRAYDFSATPFAPSGKKSTEEALFGWIVSDFGLNDAIESGLVKTPRVVVLEAVSVARTFIDKASGKGYPAPRIGSAAGIRARRRHRGCPQHGPAGAQPG